jgi:hypothetical protein
MARSYQSPFSREILRHALRWRAMRDHGDPGARTTPMFPDWLDGIHPDWRSAARQAVVEDRVRLHSHAAALHSSMTFAFNLFLPFRGAPQRLSAWASGRIHAPTTIERVAFEWVPPGGILSELRGDQPLPGEPATGIDVVLWGRDESGSIALLIEVKLTENGFTPCAGRTSRGNRRRDVCESAASFFADPAACYLQRPVRATRDRRYWTILQQPHGSLADAFPGLRGQGACPFAGDLQQPVRQLALARGLEQASAVGRAWNGLVHHDDNPDVVPPWQTFTGVVRSRRLFRAPASTLLDFVPEQHAAWMRARYRLPEVL